MMDFFALVVPVAVAVWVFRVLKKGYTGKGHKPLVSNLASGVLSFLAYLVVLIILIPGVEEDEGEGAASEPKAEISTKFVEPKYKKNPYNEDLYPYEYKVIDSFSIAFASFFGDEKESGIRYWIVDSDEWVCEYETNTSSPGATIQWVGKPKWIFSEFKEALRMTSRYKEELYTDQIRFVAYGRHRGSPDRAEKLVSMTIPWEVFIQYNWGNISVDEFWYLANLRDEYGYDLIETWVHPAILSQLN